MLRGSQLRGGKETLHFLCNNDFRVGMLEVNNVKCLVFFGESTYQNLSKRLLKTSNTDTLRPQPCMAKLVS